MSEEVTYADLKFQDTSKRKCNVEFEKLEIKDRPAPSRAWRHRVLIVLCLLLLLGLGVLGGMFYVTYKMQMKKINKLQRVKNELQRNVSLQMMDNMNSNLTIKNLSTTLQKVATDLCRELYKTKKEHKCQPCPKNWIWHDDSCYLISKTDETWEKSENKCSAQNATLLTIRSESVLKFMQSQNIYDSWLRLTLPNNKINEVNGKALSELINSPYWLINNTYDSYDKMCCGYKYKIRCMSCTYKSRFICEKLANSVKTESILFNVVQDIRR